MSIPVARRFEQEPLRDGNEIALPWAALHPKYKGCGKLFTTAGVAFHTETPCGHENFPAYN
jgi:hypothetical protein